MDLRNLADQYYQIQMTRIRAENRIRAVAQGSDKEKAAIVANDLLVLRLNEAELEAQNRMEAELPNHPCYYWGMGIPGYNRVNMCKIMGFLGDMETFHRFSNIRSFAGMAPGKNRLIKGEKATFNTRLKTALFVAFDCFIKVGGNKNLKYPPARMYSEIYRKWRGIYKERHGEGSVKKKINGCDSKGNKYTSEDKQAQEWSDLRQHFASKNKLLDVFLFHCYEEYLERVDSDKRATLYSHEYLGHHMKYDRADFRSDANADFKISEHKNRRAQPSEAQSGNDTTSAKGLQITDLEAF